MSGVGDPGRPRSPIAVTAKTMLGGKMTSENKGHLSRLGRLYNSNPLYFITTSTFKRHRFLTNNDVSRILADEWSKCLDLHGWAIGSYVIMPDHVHFFCKSATDKQNLSQVMQAWKQWTSKRIKKALYRSLPVWNSEFFDHVLRSEESYSEKWHYVFSNPVRAGLVDKPEEWKCWGFIHFK